MAQAAERAKVTASRNIPVFDDLPIPADTANLRQGANLHDALLALLPLVGVWRGEGEGRGASGDYRFGQQIVVSHDGGDYLNWEARSWRLSESGEYDGPALRETGYWRFVHDPPIRPSRRPSNCCWRTRPVTSSCSTAGRAPSRHGNWSPTSLPAASRACLSAAQNGSTGSSRAATWRTSRNGWTPTAGWYRICRRGCRGTRDNGARHGQPRADAPGWTDREARGPGDCGEFASARC
ncbi:hypothetical protein I553_5244 [Mycobacterium xenopi 4042]|uniref:THAP4-like heme-binding domain-containing protein n=1 Tax=Mycobacterium xenopi 4042 TaxID=1299334 RepID=X7ZX41_MYCXE|nr:hypothetical protein I553_5244 [Mycobacterium xenopi 4042]